MKTLISFIAALFFFIQTVSADSNSGETIHVSVNGLVCDFCAVALEKVFSKQQAVDSIKVDLDNALVVVNLKKGATIDDQLIEQLITDSGYNITQIRRETHDE